MKTNTHIVIKKEDIFKYLTDNQIKYLDAILDTITEGRKKDGKKPVNSYYICNTDEPYADEVLEVILKAEGEGYSMTKEDIDRIASEYFDDNESEHEMDEVFYLAKKALEEQTPKIGHCKHCRWWKDSDGVFRRGIGAESKCPMNTKAVCEGTAYCYMFDEKEPRKVEFL